MTWEQVLQLAPLLISIAGGLYSWHAARSAATADEAAQLAARLTRQDERLLTLEKQVEYLPDHKLVAEMMGDMKAIRTEIAGLARELGPLSRSVDRINDFLLTRSA
jgi:hypothetical protein